MLAVHGARGRYARFSGIACAGFDGPRRDDAVKNLFGAVPVLIGAPVGAAFFFVVAVGEMGDVVFGRRAGRSVG